MKFFKTINDAKLIIDKSVFILETEETQLGILVKYYLVDEDDCLTLYTQVENFNKLDRTKFSIETAEYLNKEVVIDIIKKMFISLRFFNGLPQFESPGFLTKEDFNEIISSIKGELDKNNDLANRSKTSFIKYLNYQSLNPKPSGNNQYSWLADCPFSDSKHFMMVSTKENRYGCGWCKKKGNQNDLENHFKNNFK